MSLIIEHTLSCCAPKSVLWQVITDLDKYPDWNPFVKRCRSSFKPGEPIQMKVMVIKGIEQAQTERIFEYEPEQLLSYGIGQGKNPTGLNILSSYRSHRLAVDDDNQQRSIYHSYFQLTGLVSPVVKLMLAKQLQRGFTEMSEAIIKRAEQLSNQ